MTKVTRQPVTAANAVAAQTASAPVPPETEQTAAPENEQAQDNAAVDAGEQIEGRVLIAFDDYQPNDIFVGSTDEAVILFDAQKIDCDPKAVAYAKSLSEG